MSRRAAFVSFWRSFSWPALAGLAACTCIAVLLSALFVRDTLAHTRSLRGVALGALPALLPARAGGSPYGVNVALHNDPASLERSLDLAQQAGLVWLRQRFAWADIEPARGVFRWQVYDRIVEQAIGRGLRLVAVLDTSPAWARSSSLVTSPPDQLEDYGAFVAAFVERYRGRVEHIQIWDEPNVAPRWGDGWASPEEYTAVLRLAYGRAKGANPNVTVLAGGLAPTVADDQWNLNDVTFLRRMYAHGARGFFDILAAKPYGFWSGPDDRRVDAATLNFSRLILLRDVMVKNGDENRLIWAVEMGWNALPPDWSGKPAPWGSDSEERQAQRLVAALERAQAEWPWLEVAIVQGLRFAGATADDPVRGFALVDDAFRPRQAYAALRAVAAAPHVAGVGRYAANTSSAVYSPGWTPAAAGDGPTHSSRQAGAEVTFRFDGTGIAVYAWHGPGAGRLNLWLDGQPVERLPRGGPGTGFIELARQTVQGMTGVIVATGLPDDEHTLRLQTAAGLAGATVTLGGFEVIRALSFLPFYGWLALLAAGIVASLTGIVALAPRLPWQAWDDVIARAPAPLVLVALVVLAALFYLLPWLPLAALGALAFAALAMARLDLALLATALTFPFYLYPKQVGGQAFSLPEVLTLACFGGWLVRGLGLRDWGRRGAFLLPALAFLAAGVVALWAANDVRLGLRELRVVVIEPALFYIMAASIVGAKHSGGDSPAHGDQAQYGSVSNQSSSRMLRPYGLSARALTWALVLSAAVAALQALVQLFVFDHAIAAEGVRRALGPYGSPNNLGLLLERVLPLAAALLLASVARGRESTADTRRTSRDVPSFRTLGEFGTMGPPSVALIVACALMAAALFLTYSIGAWLGVVAGLLVLAARRGRRAVAALALVLIVLGVALLPLLRVERVVSHLGLSGETTTNLRLDLWRSSVEMLRDYPLQGVGLDGFLDLYRGVYIRPSALREPGLSHPHNLVLEWQLFLGIVGAPLLLWFLAAFVHRVRQASPGRDTSARWLVDGALAGITAALVHGLVDRFYFGAPDLAFLFFALLLLVEAATMPGAASAGDTGA